MFKLIPPLILVCLVCLIHINNVCDLGLRHAECAEQTIMPKIACESGETVSADELLLVEKIVAAESRGEPKEAQMAVAQTILDRHTQSGLSISEVCLSPGQFADPYSGEISEEVKDSVYYVFILGQRVYEEPTLSFHDDSMTPYWAKDKVCRGQIGRMIFYGE